MGRKGEKEGSGRESRERSRNRGVDYAREGEKEKDLVKRSVCYTEIQNIRFNEQFCHRS